MLSLRGNVFSAEITHDTRALKQAIKGGNIEKTEKKRLTSAIQKIEKEEKQQKQPARDLRAMYGND